MTFGEITTTDRAHWQHRGAGVLSVLAEEGFRAGRHPLDWTLFSNGSLRGEVSALDGLGEGDRHAVYEEWRHVLAASDSRESRNFGGGVRLTSLFNRPTNRGDVQGSLVLDIAALFGDEDQEDGGRG